MSDELQPGSWDLVRELIWFGHPLMIEAANEIKRLRNYTKTGLVEASGMADEIKRLRAELKEARRDQP